MPHVMLRRSARAALFCVSLLVALSLGTRPLGAQTQYGDSCSTISRGHSVCARHNDQEVWRGGTLPKRSRIFVSVGNSSASQVSGFALYLKSRSNKTEYIGAYLYSSSNGQASGVPDKQLAAGILTVTTQAGWHRARLCPQVSLPAGYYFIAYDNPETSLDSSLTGNGPLSNYYYRPEGSSRVGPLQARFMRRILCGGDCPRITGSAARIRAQWTVGVEAPPGSFAVLMIGASNTQIGQRSLPIPLSFLNRPGCNVWTSMDIQMGAMRVATTGKASLSAEIKDLSLKDKIAYGQWFVFDVWGNQITTSVTKGMRFKIVQTVPAAPSNLSVTAPTLSSTTVSWRDNSDDEAGFHVMLSTDGSSYALAASRAPNRTQADLSGLQRGTRYWVKVRAHNESGFADSAPITFTTKDTPPVAPSQFVITKAYLDGFDVQWRDNSDNEEGFWIRVSTDGQNFSNHMQVARDTSSARIRGLKAATRYWCRVRAFNAYGRNVSNIDDDTTHRPKPPAPGNVAVSAVRQSTATVSWTGTTSQVAGFHVLLSTDGRSYSLKGARAPNARNLAMTGLRPNTTYWVIVRAHNESGSTDSGAVTFKTWDNPPAAPHSLQVLARRSRQFDIAWVDASTNETGFHVGVSTNGTSFSRVATLGAGTTAYTITNLTPNTKYWIRVRAYNAFGTSDSNVPTSTTLNSPPNRPSNLVFSEISRNGVRITFQDNSDNEAGFYVETRRANVSTANWIRRLSLPRNDRDERFAGLRADTLYDCRVIAHNNGGTGTSRIAQFRTAR